MVLGGREGGRGWKRISGWDGGPGAVVNSFCCVLCFASLASGIIVTTDLLPFCLMHILKCTRGFGFKLYEILHIL